MDISRQKRYNVLIEYSVKAILLSNGGGKPSGRPYKYREAAASDPRRRPQSAPVRSGAVIGI